LAVEGDREVDGYLPAQAAREARGMIYETYFLCFWAKSSALPEMDTTAGRGEEKNGAHGDNLAYYEYDAPIRVTMDSPRRGDKDGTGR